MCCQAPLAFCILRSFELPLSHFPFLHRASCNNAGARAHLKCSKCHHWLKRGAINICIYRYIPSVEGSEGRCKGGVSYYYIKSASGFGFGCCCRSWPGFIRARHALHIGNKCSKAGKKESTRLELMNWEIPCKAWKWSWKGEMFYTNLIYRLCEETKSSFGRFLWQSCLNN